MLRGFRRQGTRKPAGPRHGSNRAPCRRGSNTLITESVAPRSWRQPTDRHCPGPPLRCSPRDNASDPLYRSRFFALLLKCPPSSFPYDEPYVIVPAVMEAAGCAIWGCCAPNSTFLMKCNLRQDRNRWFLDRTHVNRGSNVIAEAEEWHQRILAGKFPGHRNREPARQLDAEPVVSPKASVNRVWPGVSSRKLHSSHARFMPRQ